MSTYTLEGTDLEELLARVPVEHGDQAVIVAANKLRTGGIGGFFTKEAYEVVVEVPDDEPAATDSPGDERAWGEPAGAPAVAVPTAPTLSTESVGFAGVLERMVRDAGAADEAPRPVGPAMQAAAARTGSADASGDEPFEPLTTARVPRATVGTAPTPTPPTASPAAAVAALTAGAIPAPAPVPAPVATETTTALAPAASAAPAFAAPAATPMAPALDQRWLARIGVPTSVAAQLTTVSTDPEIELLHLMEQVSRPDPLPTGAGSVIAVVGRRADAIEVCDRFAEQLGLNPQDVLVAASAFRGNAVSEDRRITSIELAEERRRSWCRRRRPTIVAVDAPLGRARTGWATHLLEALEPTMVWGVVEACRKPEDIRDWAQRLGGLDALAVTGLDDTVSPATVLGAGVPVGLLDGHDATPSRWTAVLVEHLELAA